MVFEVAEAAESDSMYKAGTLTENMEDDMWSGRRRKSERGFSADVV